MQSILGTYRREIPGRALEFVKLQAIEIPVEEQPDRAFWKPDAKAEDHREILDKLNRKVHEVLESQDPKHPYLLQPLYSETAIRGWLKSDLLRDLASGSEYEFAIRSWEFEPENERELATWWNRCLPLPELLLGEPESVPSESGATLLQQIAENST
ncbi:MAG: hypothetical protein AAF483_01355 [Planctomycetota bacterium]